jgi:hypothetical protein
MDKEGKNGEEIKSEDKICPGCGLRQYGTVCANCQIEMETEEDSEKRKEDEYDEYDWREKR